MGESKVTTVLVVVHGDYGYPLVDAAEAIVGPLDVGVVAFCFEADGQQVRRRLAREIAGRDRGGGVLVLTDLCGSTPANICQIAVAERGNSAAVSGLNLPMLLKLSTCDRTVGAHRLAEELCATSRRSIIVGDPGADNGGVSGD